MNEKVKEFLDELKSEETNELREKKREILSKLEIFEKEYSPDDTYSDEYCEVEKLDESDIKYYKKVYPEISDEEYEALKKELEKRNPPKKPFIVRALIIFAWVYLAVSVVSTAFTTISYIAQYSEYSSQIMPQLLPSLISGLISAAVRWITFMAYAKVIELLYDIKNK